MLVTPGVCPRCRGNHKKLVKKLALIREQASEKARALMAQAKDLPGKERPVRRKSLKLAEGYLDYLCMLARLATRCHFDMAAIAEELMCTPERAQELVTRLCRQCSPDRQFVLRRMTAGLCVGCGKRKPQSKTMCQYCLAKDRARNLRRMRRTGMTDQKLYHMRKEKGLCIQCGKRDARPGLVMCQQCRDADALRVRERARRAHENSRR